MRKSRFRACLLLALCTIVEAPALPAANQRSWRLVRVGGSRNRGRARASTATQRQHNRRVQQQRTTARRVRQVQHQSVSRQQRATAKQQTALAQQEQRLVAELESLRWQTQTLAELNRIVDLTADQKTAFQPLIAGMAARIQVADGTPGLSPAERRNRIQQAYAQAWRSIEPALTPRQKDDFQAHQTLQRMTRELDLTGSQESEIRATLKQQNAANELLRANSSLGAAQRKTRLQDEDDDTWRTITGRLTSSQRDKLARLGQDDFILSLSRTLQLSDDQRKSINQIVDEAWPGILRLRDDPAMKEGTRSSLLSKLRDSMWSDIRAELTAAQQQRLDTARAAER